MATKSITRDIVISDPESIKKLRSLSKEHNPKFKELLRKSHNLKIEKVSKVRIKAILNIINAIRD